MKAAVVGHVEWIDFVRVNRLPLAGEIIHASEAWEEPGGGGAVAAVQLAKLAGGVSFFTALADTDLGRRSALELEGLGVGVKTHFHTGIQRRAITYIDAQGERTITALGKRFGPGVGDLLPWDELDETDCVYLSAGDSGAVKQARRARILVATSRVVPLLAQAGVKLDALVGSAADPGEVYRPGDLDPPPKLVVKTAGAEGGTFQVEGSPAQSFKPAPLGGPVADTYGAGDSFAAGLTFALAAGYSVEEAVGLAARCGAAVLSGRGPYAGQLTAEDL